MHEVEQLRTLRPIWLHRALQDLVRGAGLREDFSTQMEKFYDMLERSVETGNPAWLDSLLAQWAASLTQTDLEAGSSSLTCFISELVQLTYSTICETLDETSSIQLYGSLLKVFSYIYDRAAQYEIQARIAYVSNELNKAQQNLERLDRSKSDFIAVAAHELKTPLTLVEGYTAMLGESLNGDPRASAHAYLVNGIHNGTRRLQMIIDDMIDVSLIDNNMLKLNFQPVWINRLLSALSYELEPICTERSLKLEIENFPGSADMTFGDPERLLQLLRNVMTNAIKFTPDGGKITVTGNKLPGFVEVEIIDTGIGIAPEDQPYIFEKFGRLGNISLHSSGKTKFKGGGPGLGLHIARGIIESHGGAIWVDSPGYDEKSCPGSVFHLLLPQRTEPPDKKMAKIFKPVVER